MRIRKNAKLSPLLFSSSCAAAASSSSISSQGQGGSSVPVVTFQTHVCQLNQSPWDVIPFDSDSIQFEGGDSFTAGNGGSVGDSVGAVESVASMMKIDDDNHDNYHKVVAENSCCNGVDGKGLPCKNEPKQGQSFCNHHLSLLRSYNNNNNTPSTKKATAVVATALPAATTAPTRRGRARAAATGKKTAAAAATSSNPNEFYYYSGFGPSWSKRRGDRNNGRGENNSAVAESENVMKAQSTPASDVNAAQSVEIENNIEDDEFDYVDNDEDEDANDDDDSGKKRMRKPVKARSLKSLM